MNKLKYILSIFSFMSIFFAEEGCMDVNACNYDPNATVDCDDCCDNSPGLIDDLSVNVPENQNYATIDFSRPCGGGTFFIYRIQETDDPNDQSGYVVEPGYVIADLAWSSSYNFFLRTTTLYGNSFTPFEVTIDSEPAPLQISGFTSTTGEASITLTWSEDVYSVSYNVYMDGSLFEVVADSAISFNNLYANTDYSFQVAGVNSSGIEGELSEIITTQVSSIPVVTNILSTSESGQVTFEWLYPDSYAGISDYSFILYSEDEILESSYSDNSYTISDLSFGDSVCINIVSNHYYGISDQSEEVCQISSHRPFPEVDGITLVSGQGFVDIEWSNYIWSINNNGFPWVSKYNIYRDDVLIAGEVYVYSGNGEYRDSTNIVAGSQYAYQIVGINPDDLEGEYHEPISVTVDALPIINDLSISPDNGRLLLEWSAPEDYNSTGYYYEVFNSSNNLVKAIPEPGTHIPDLLNDIEYCFKVRSVSLAGYGYSDFSDTVCGIPDAPFGENFGWSIQILAEITDYFGESFTNIGDDQYNLIGVDYNATDGFDSGIDIPEPTVLLDRISLFFHRPEWNYIFDGLLIDEFTQDVRAYPALDSTLSSSVIAWEAKLKSSAQGGFPELTFYFNNIFDISINEDLYTVYLSYIDNEELIFQKIEDGQTIRFPWINVDEEKSLSIIVGNAIPDPPINLAGYGGYREIEITWEDACCQSGLQQYPAESYNVWRDGLLVGQNIFANSFIDRGLDYDQLYTYQISALNVAGEGEKSQQSMQFSTLGNRAPSSKAGLDVIVYDLSDNGSDVTILTLPVYSDFTNQNQSFDIDNSYEQNGEIYLYPQPLDDLNFSWTSASSNEYTTPELSIQIQTYSQSEAGCQGVCDGDKGFELTVDDGNGASSSDSVYVRYLPPPIPAVVDSINSDVGLYYVELEWLESMFTGESYADLNRNLQWDDNEHFNDCGLDNLCPGNLNYSYPDEGESNGIWDFEDLDNNGLLDIGEQYEPWQDDNYGQLSQSQCEENVNSIWYGDESTVDQVANCGNGIWDASEPFIDSPNDDGVLNNTYDSGPHPRPPFFGLPSNIGPDNLATKYIIRRDEFLILEIMADDSTYLNASQDGDLFNRYTFYDDDLSPSTEYCYQILACNFVNDCSYSQEQCITTKDKPSVSIQSPNGAEIIGAGNLDVELEFENIESIGHIDIYLSYDGSFNESDLYPILSTDQISSTYYNIDASDFSSFTNEAQIKVEITDVGERGLSSSDDGSEYVNYVDYSDNAFIISKNEAVTSFDSGWHLFGTPVGLVDNDFYSTINGSGVGFNWVALDPFEMSGTNSPSYLNSGEGYYIWIGDDANMTLGGELFNHFNIQLSRGWNLISNPIIEPINIGGIDIIQSNGDSLTMRDAINSGLVSSRLLGFDNLSTTHFPSYDIEPFMGYWFYAFEDSLSLSIRNKVSSDILSQPNEDSDWRLVLTASALGAGEEFYNPFGDKIEIGFSDGASDGFRPGEDEYHLPFTSSFSNYTYFWIDNSSFMSDSINGDYNPLYYEYLDYAEFSSDIRQSNDTLYVWDIVGDAQNILNSNYNPNDQILISWEQVNDLGDGYSLTLFVGDASYDMKDPSNNPFAISRTLFEEMRIEVDMIEYTSGCSDINACNYYCVSNVDCTGDSTPKPFYDDGSCEYTSCIGCSDESASNYNPTSDDSEDTWSVNCEYLQSFLLSSERNIYPEFPDSSFEYQNRIPVYLYSYVGSNSLRDNIYGIEIQLVVDREKAKVIDVDLSDGIFSDDYNFGGSISIYDNDIENLEEQLVESDYSFFWGYTSTVSDTLGLVLYSTINPIRPENDVSKMFDLILDVEGEIGEQLTVDFVKSDFNIQTINSNFQKLNIVQGLFDVSSSVEYYSSPNTAIDDVSLDLIGISELTSKEIFYNQLSNIEGNISYTDMLRGNYLGVISKNDNSSLGLSAVDASRIARNTVGLFALDSAQKYLADVDFSGSINPNDASLVARLIVGNIESLNNQQISWRFIPKDQNILTVFDESFIAALFQDSDQALDNFSYNLDWVFDPLSADLDVLQNTQNIIDALVYHEQAILNDPPPPNQFRFFHPYEETIPSGNSVEYLLGYVENILRAESLSSVSTNNLNQSFVGYKIGDVDGDWFEDATNFQRQGDSVPYALNLHPEEDNLSLDIMVEEESFIEGVEFEISFNSDIFEFIDFEIKSSTLTQDNYHSMFSNKDGQISFVMYCASELLVHEGVLASLVFKITDLIPENSLFSLNKLSVNGKVSGESGFKVSDGDSFSVVQSIVLNSSYIPVEYSLSQNYPNPFNPSTSIPFTLPMSSSVKLEVFDIRGRLVQELLDSEMDAGYYSIPWDASHLSSGLYFIKLESIALGGAKSFSKIQKSLLIK